MLVPVGCPVDRETLLICLVAPHLSRQGRKIDGMAFA